MPISATQPTVSADGAPVKNGAEHPIAPIDPGTPVGRYLLLDTVGRGGMGIVYSAYDPDLDRKIAIKILRAGRAGRAARARLLREAQALARLTHPNVVTIYDVGMLNEDVYIAMELVAGQTVDQWLAKRRRPWSEVLRVYLAAGEGLAAAHERDIVHRDFKPSNVMVDQQHQVRVLDFGLARRTDVEVDAQVTPFRGSLPRLVEPWSPLTRGDGMIGTPAYMAPEQFSGEDTDARTDQFSFCVALWESVYGVPPFSGETWDALAEAVQTGHLRAPPPSAVPLWLHRALARGLARDPERRFASMTELLAVLERGLARRRRRPLWALGGLGLALVAGTAGYRGYARHQQQVGCTESKAQIEHSWDDTARQRLEQALRASELSYVSDTTPRVLSRLDEWTQQWSDTREQACLAELDGHLAPELTQRSRECFEERKVEFDALVAALMDADATTLPRAVHSTHQLEEPEHCADLRRLALRPSIPAEDADEIREVRRRLAEAKSWRLTGQHLRAQPRVEQVVLDSDALGYAPLRAEAKLEQGYLMSAIDRPEDAQAALRSAYVEAVNTGAHELAATAATELIYVVGHQRAHHHAGLAWATVAEAAVALVEPQPGLRTANLYQARATVSAAQADYAQVRAYSEQAVELRERLLGAGHPSLAASLNNIAMATRFMGEPAEAIPLQRRALAAHETSFGPRHPKVAEMASNLALALVESGQIDEAIPLLKRARTIWTEAFGNAHVTVAVALHNLAYAHLALGEYEPAEAHLLRAIDIRERANGPEDRGLSSVLLGLAALYYAIGDFDQSEPLAKRALRLCETQQLDNPDLAYALYTLGSLHLERGELDTAREHHERALAIQKKIFGPDHDTVAKSLAALARVAHRSGSPEEAETLYRQALGIAQSPDASGTSRPPDARTLMGLAAVTLDLQRPSEALALAEQAVALYGTEHAAPRFVAQGHLVLARALWSMDPGQGHDRARAVELVTHAIQEIEGLAGARSERVPLEDWLAAHRDEGDA